MNCGKRSEQYRECFYKILVPWHSCKALNVSEDWIVSEIMNTDEVQEKIWVCTQVQACTSAYKHAVKVASDYASLVFIAHSSSFCLISRALRVMNRVAWPTSDQATGVAPTFSLLQNSTKYSYKLAPTFQTQVLAESKDSKGHRMCKHWNSANAALWIITEWAYDVRCGCIV